MATNLLNKKMVELVPKNLVAVPSIYSLTSLVIGKSLRYVVARGRDRPAQGSARGSSRKNPADLAIYWVNNWLETGILHLFLWHKSWGCKGPVVMAGFC